MKGITHERAVEYIHLGLPHLDEFQKIALSVHLSGCTACQDYASLQDRLSPLLSQAMHDRWDGHRLPTGEPGEITSRYRRNAKARNVLPFAYAVFLLVALIFGSYAIYNRIPLPVLQPGSNFQSTETMTAVLPAQLDTTVCSQQAFPAPAEVNLPYPATKVIGGDTVKQDNFTFKIYLYCDHTLRPDDPQHFSEIAGLGIWSQWSYDGPGQEGEFLWMHGTVPSLKTSLPSLKKGDSGGTSGGLSFPSRSSSEWQVTELAKSGKTIQYSIKVGTEDRLYGATLSFRLQEGTSGYMPVDVEVKLYDE